MPKLSSAQRKELPADQFGLPEDRAFPMPDENHVRSAIAYFHTCPPKKRKQLATNINRLAKQYGMKIKLKKYSAFKPYADKDIIAAESSTIDYLEAPTITMEEKHVIMNAADYADGNLTFDTWSKIVRNQLVDPEHLHQSCQFSDRLNDAINQAIKKSAQNYLDKEYILNGRFNTTRISDYVYDTDLKLCYDITRNFFYTKSVYDANMLEKIRRVANKDMLIKAFGEIKNHVDAPIITKMCDDIDFVIRQSNPPDDKWPLTGDYDWRMKDELLNPRDWATNGINLSNMNDFGFLARPSNYRNFSDEEIHLFLSNHRIVNKICELALLNMVENFGFPPIKEGTNIANDVLEMDRRGIIDGYYICGDNDDIERATAFKVAVKMKDMIYIPVHIYRDEEKSIITMVKMFDNEVHKNYFIHISDIFLRSRERKLPKMPVRRITFYITKTALESTIDGISVSPTGEINLDIS